MKLIRVDTHEELSQYVCRLCVQKIKELKNPVLGLATGSTPERLYNLLAEQYKIGNVSFKDTRTFNLDEYAGLSASNENSYRYFMDSILFNYIDIPYENTHVPNGTASDLKKESLAYEEKIQKAGGIDLQVLGIGRNGHIGFNEPGTSFESGTHVVNLDDSTRLANARFFTSQDKVPARAITMGIRAIMESREIVLMVSGEKKAEALYKLMSGEVTEEFPASVLQKHPNVLVVADRTARSVLVGLMG